MSHVVSAIAPCVVADPLNMIKAPLSRKGTGPQSELKKHTVKFKIECILCLFFKLICSVLKHRLLCVLINVPYENNLFLLVY